MAKKSTVGRASKKVSDQQVAIPQGDAVSDQTVTRVRELAWTGQHAAAIDSAAQELSRLPKSLRLRKSEMDLLDLRAESLYWLSETQICGERNETAE